MSKQNNNSIIFWIIGIIALIIVISNAPGFHFPFAIVTTQVCAPGVTHYWSFDGNLLDSAGNADLTNNGASFVEGKIGQGLSFNGTNYISFPSVSGDVGMWIKKTGEDWKYVELINGTSYGGQIIAPSENFGIGFVGVVDEIVMGNNLNISGLSGVQACYTQTTQQNITCTTYFKSTLTDPGYGCLNYSEGFFPDCNYQWLNQSSYSIENNVCKKNFYCYDCSAGCHPSYQSCIENLTYNCYVLANNACVRKIDYASCIANANSSYSTSEGCNTHIQTSTPSGEIVSQPSEEETIGLTNKEIFNIGGYSITVIHLIILLIAVLAILYFTGALGK